MAVSRVGWGESIMLFVLLLLCNNFVFVVCRLHLFLFLFVPLFFIILFHVCIFHTFASSLSLLILCIFLLLFTL